MNKMNVEKIEKLLKDMAMNIGYDLISKPFDTPFSMEGVKELPAKERLLWPVPASVLDSTPYEDFRKRIIKSDLIDTVCITSLSWPSEKNDRLAILLIDSTRKRRGTIKFVDSTSFDIFDKKRDGMAAVCNMLIHDLFPGEEFLTFEMWEDIMDIELDDPWKEYVGIYEARDIDTLHPIHYLYKPDLLCKPESARYDEEGACLVGDIFNCRYPITIEDVIGLKKTAILLSTIGKLSLQIVNPGENPHKLVIKDKMLLVPDYDVLVNFDIAFNRFYSEEVIRQLPIFRKITISDMLRVQIEKRGLYTIDHEAEDPMLHIWMQKLSKTTRNDE